MRSFRPALEAVFESIDAMEAEGRYRQEPLHDLSPEKLIERHWALTLIGRALAQTAGNQTRAAELLGLSRFGLQKKLRRMGIGDGE